MWNLIKELAGGGVTIFLTTQYMEEADRLADKIAVISNGVIVAEDKSELLKRIVGEEKLELSFLNQDELYEAQLLFNGHVDYNESIISIRTDESAGKLREILNNLHEHNIEPATISIRKPTLDDFFMQITSENTKGGNDR